MFSFSYPSLLFLFHSLLEIFGEALFLDGDEFFSLLVLLFKGEFSVKERCLLAKDEK